MSYYSLSYSYFFQSFFLELIPYIPIYFFFFFTDPYFFYSLSPTSINVSISSKLIAGKSLQSCLTLCDPMDCSLPGSSVHDIFSRQEHWSGLLCPPPQGVPDPGIKSRSPVSCTGKEVLYHEHHLGSHSKLTYLLPFSMKYSLCKKIHGSDFIRVFAFNSAFPDGSAGKESPCNAGDLGLIPGLGRLPTEGKDYRLQYSVLEKSMDCTVQGVKKRQT